MSSRKGNPPQAGKTPFYEGLSKKKKNRGPSADTFESDYYDDDFQDAYEGKSTSKKPVEARKAYQGKGKPASSTVQTENKPSHTVKGKKVVERSGGFERMDQKPRYDRSLDAYRSEPKCGVFGACGGCQLQHLTYEGQLKYKQKKIEQLMGAFGKVSPIIGMENPEHYRNKVHATFSYDKRGKIVAGIYEEDSHRVIPITNCLIQDKRANGIIQTILGLMPSFKMTPYDEDYDTGFLRHVLIRTGHVTGEVMVVIVGGNPIMPSKNNFVKALVKAHPEISTVVFNVNNRRTSMVLGAYEKVLYGKGYIEDVLCGTTFRISPKSFYQINSVQTEKLYDKAMEYAALTGTENVLDAYCGIGTIGLIASKKAGEVIGVELNKDAVKDAVANAKLNSITNTQFYQGDAGDFMLEMAAENETLDVVFMDPPRSGSDDNFLSALVKLGPKRVVYVSCGPETLARDVRYLTLNGYSVKAIQPYDMFPWTEHVEAIILMTRSGSGDKK